MYLEISPRQTGKTSRLVEAAANSFMQADLQTKKIMLVGHSGPMTRILHERVSDTIACKLNSKVSPELLHMSIKESLIATHNPHQYIASQKGTAFDTIDSWNFFFDEFDFIKPEHIIITENGYYSSTAKRGRTVDDLLSNALGTPDVLLDLLAANGGRHVTHSVVNLFENMTLKQIRSMCKTLSPESAAIEFGNQYIKIW